MSDYRTTNEAIPLFDAPSAPKEDRPRLKGQCQAIYERLQQGPATNTELAVYSLKYTSRISDIRKAGYRVDCKKLGGGLTEYTLRDT